MEQQFDIQIDNVTRKEYVQAGSETIRRMILPLLALVTVFTVVIAMAVQNFSLQSLLLPFGVAIAFLLVMYIMVLTSWKNFPSDTQFSYLIDEDGWEITVGESRANIDWDKTTRMTVRSHVVLLFNEANRSNMLPRRCLTNEQLAQMQQWFRESRSAFKDRQKADEEQFRKDYRLKRIQERSNRKHRWF